MTVPAHPQREPAPSVRSRILLATLEIIAEGSIDAVTHRAVATRAGVSPGSTTHHFSTRDELVHETFRWYLQIAETKIRSVIDEHSHLADPVDRVGGMLTTIVGRDFASGLVRAEYELLLYAATAPELATDARAFEDRLVNALADALEHGGATRPVRTARTLVNLARGFELESMLDPALTDIHFRERIDMILTALIPESTRTDVMHDTGQ